MSVINVDAFKNAVPWIGVRKTLLHYGDITKQLAKMTLNGINYNFARQAREGLVVVGSNYSSATFFLPTKKKTVTEQADTDSMSLWDYLNWLTSDEHCAVGAWNKFASMLAKKVAGNVSDGNLSYTLSGGSGVSMSGKTDFAAIETMADYINGLRDGLSEAAVASAQASPLSDWLEEDGAVKIKITVKLSIYTLNVTQYIGRR